MHYFFILLMHMKNIERKQNKKNRQRKETIINFLVLEMLFQQQAVGSTAVTPATPAIKFQMKSARCTHAISNERREIKLKRHLRRLR